MSSLTRVYEQISARDADMLEKQAAALSKQAEEEKQAAEEEFAGRIMARGFAAELHKLAEADVGRPIGSGGGTVKSAPFAPAAPGMTGGNMGRKAGAPGGGGLAAGRFTRGQGGYGGTNLNVASGSLGGQPGAMRPKKPAGVPGQ
jgi:hypothetical protein